MKQVIQVINKTKEDTGMLRKLTKFIASSRGISDNIEIIFCKSRNIYCTGRAYINSVIYSDLSNNSKREILGWHKSLRIRLPVGWKDKLPEVAAVMQHEFDHTLGLRHKYMFWDRKKIYNDDPAKYFSAEYINQVKKIVGVIE